GLECVGRRFPLGGAPLIARRCFRLLFICPLLALLGQARVGLLPALFGVSEELIFGRTAARRFVRTDRNFSRLPVGVSDVSCFPGVPLSSPSCRHGRHDGVFFLPRHPAENEDFGQAFVDTGRRHVFGVPGGDRQRQQQVVVRSISAPTQRVTAGAE